MSSIEIQEKTKNLKVLVIGFSFVGCSILIAPIVSYDYKVSECLSTMKRLGWYTDKTTEEGFRIQCYKMIGSNN
jgi:hypothetical protein